MFTAAEVGQFNRDGYVVARGLATPADRSAIKAVAERDLAAAVPPVEYETDTKYPGAPVSFEAPGGRTVRRLLQACARDPLIARWAVQPAIAARCSN
jgi:phytanoyl-CoA hydroxylase